MSDEKWEYAGEIELVSRRGYEMWQGPTGRVVVVPGNGLLSASHSEIAKLGILVEANSADDLLRVLRLLGERL